MGKRERGRKVGNGKRGEKRETNGHSGATPFGSKLGDELVGDVLVVFDSCSLKYHNIAIPRKGQHEHCETCQLSQHRRRE
jgi:hypothetical protein